LRSSFVNSFINVECLDSSAFSIVILSNPGYRLLATFSAECWAREVPLVVVRSCGLLGYYRIQIKEQYSIPNTSDVYDLRIANPFDELKVLKYV
jgi:hypothetical protein